MFVSIKVDLPVFIFLILCLVFCTLSFHANNTCHALNGNPVSYICVLFPPLSSKGKASPSHCWMLIFNQFRVLATLVLGMCFPLVTPHSS